MGFEVYFKTENPTAKSGFPILYQRRESNPHIRGYTILSRARLPVPPLWLVYLHTRRSRARLPVRSSAKAVLARPKRSAGGSPVPPLWHWGANMGKLYFLYNLQLNIFLNGKGLRTFGKKGLYASPYTTKKLGLSVCFKAPGIIPIT